MQPQPEPSGERTSKQWWQKKWVWWVAGIVGLLVLIAIVSDPDESTTVESVNPPPAAAAPTALEDTVSDAGSPENKPQETPSGDPEASATEEPKAEGGTTGGSGGSDRGGSGESTSSKAAEGEWQAVTNVVDGDTIDVENDGRVRLIGIDTPERGDCFFGEASDHVRDLVNDGQVRLEQDPTQDERDRYDRLLAYVWLDVDTMLNELMVADGFAREYTYDNPYRYQKQFLEAETNANADGLGLWSACRVPAPPPLHRRHHQTSRLHHRGYRTRKNSAYRRSHPIWTAARSSTRTSRFGLTTRTGSTETMTVSDARDSTMREGRRGLRCVEGPNHEGSHNGRPRPPDGHGVDRNPR